MGKDKVGPKAHVIFEEASVLQIKKGKGSKPEVVDKGEIPLKDLKADAAQLGRTVKGGERAGSLGEAHEITVLPSYIGGASNQKFDGVVLAEPNDAGAIKFALAQGLQRAGMAQGKLVYCKPEDVARMKGVIANPDDLLMQIK